MEADQTKQYNDSSKQADSQAQIPNRIAQITPPNSADSSSDGADIHKATPQIHSTKKHDGKHNQWEQWWDTVRRGWSLATTERINAFSTLVIAVFTVALVVVGILQWLDLKKSTEAAQTAAQAAADTVELTKQGAKTADTTAAALQKTAEANAQSAEASQKALDWYKKQTDVGEVAANASKQSADAASASFLQNQQFNQLSMRAFLFITDTKLESTKTPRQVIATISIENTGQTPAHDVHLFTKIDCLMNGDTPTPFLKPDLNAAMQARLNSAQSPPLTAEQIMKMPVRAPQPLTPLQKNLLSSLTTAPKSVGPTGKFQVSLAFPLADDSSWKAWNAGNAIAWFSGLISYDDEFGKLHYTQFTYRQEKDLKNGSPILNLADFGNDME